MELSSPILDAITLSLTYCSVKCSGEFCKVIINQCLSLRCVIWHCLGLYSSMTYTKFIITQLEFVDDYFTLNLVLRIFSEFNKPIMRSWTSHCILTL